MRIDDDKDLAEQVESALRALGIAATRSNAEHSPSMVDAVSALRRDNGRPRIEALDVPLHEGEEQR